MKGRFLLLTAAVTATVAAIPAAATDVVDLRLNGHYYSAPATVQITVTVEPNQSNRMLRIEADGDQMYRSTEVSLDGQLEKRVHVVEFKNLPAGVYELRAEVLSARQVRGVATQELEVMGR